MEAYLKTEDVALRVRRSDATVRYWRHIGVGPPGFRVGRGVLYRESDVQAWLDGLREREAGGAA